MCRIRKRKGEQVYSVGLYAHIQFMLSLLQFIRPWGWYLGEYFRGFPRASRYDRPNRWRDVDGDHGSSNSSGSMAASNDHTRSFVSSQVVQASIKTAGLYTQLYSPSNSGGFRGWRTPPPLLRNPNLCTVQKCAIILAWLDETSRGKHPLCRTTTQ